MTTKKRESNHTIVIKHEQAATEGQMPVFKRQLCFIFNRAATRAIMNFNRSTPDEIAGEMSSDMILPSNLVVKSYLFKSLEY